MPKLFSLAPFNILLICVRSWFECCVVSRNNLLMLKLARSSKSWRFYEARQVIDVMMSVRDLAVRSSRNNQWFLTHAFEEAERFAFVYSHPSIYVFWYFVLLLLWLVNSICSDRNIFAGCLHFRIQAWVSGVGRSFTNVCRPLCCLRLLRTLLLFLSGSSYSIYRKALLRLCVSILWNFTLLSFNRNCLLDLARVTRDRRRLRAGLGWARKNLSHWQSNNYRLKRSRDSGINTLQLILNF